MKGLKFIFAISALSLILSACSMGNNEPSPSLSPSDNSENIGDNAGKAVEDITDGAGNAVKDAGDAVGNAVKDITK